MSLTQFAMVEELAQLIRDNLSNKHLVLSVEDALVNFLRADPSPNGTVELQPMGPYHRLLLHRLADIFGFSHESIGEGEDRRLVLACCSETSIPSILVGDILYQQDLYQSQATPYEILKREDGSRATSSSSNRTTEAEIVFCPSSSGRNSAPWIFLKGTSSVSVLEIKSALPPTTLEEREEAYQAARRRIFSTYDDDGSGEAIRQKPRHVPVVAQRMIAHALGQRINPSSQIRGDDCGKPSAKADVEESPDAISRRVKKLSCNDTTSNSKPNAVNKEVNGSRSIEDMKRENLGAAKRMFAQALGKQSGRKADLPGSGK